MDGSRRRVAVVVGGDPASPEALAAAERVGWGLVEAGFRVATGGLGGVMAAASRGARSAPSWSEGRVIGVLPGLDPARANPHVDIALPTGLGHGRNLLLVAMADVVVAVEGGAGTLSEVALAWVHGKPVVALDLGRGWSSRLAGDRLDARRPDRVHRAADPDEAVRLAARLAGSG